MHTNAAQKTPAGATAAVEFKLKAEDGFELPATLVLPETSNGIVVQINPAAITPMRYYRAFAEHLAARGFGVLTYEVRGMLMKEGESAKDSPAGVLKWGRLDHTAATRYLRTQYPRHRLAIIGHSMGGQLTGMSPLVGDASAVLLVACADGYWRKTGGGPLKRLRRGAMVCMVGPALIALLGYLPSFVVGGLPKSAAYGGELLRFMRSRHFFCDEQGRPLRPHHGDIRVPLRHIVLTDDERFPVDCAMDVADRYPNAAGECIVLSPADYGVAKIGHHGLFHRGMARKAWDDMAQWLEAAVRRDARHVPAVRRPGMAESA